jgi:D-lactate dehydrogenase
MKTIFFEVQDWEKEDLMHTFPDAVLTSDKLSLENVAQFSDAEIISSFIYSTLDKSVLEKLPQLTLIATRSTGYDHIDLSYCKEKNIGVANVPEYGSNTVAEATFALLLALTRKIPQAIEQAKSAQFNPQLLMGVDLKDKTIGVVGLGKIGTNVVRIAKGFGMKVIVYNHSQDEKLQQDLGFTYTTLENLLANADVVTLHVPLTDATRHMIHKDNILQMKQNSYLINTARGGLIETEAIVLGLEKGILAGVGLDVLEDEKELNEEAALLLANTEDVTNLKTLLYDHILMNHPKVIITPHNAFNSLEAVKRILTVTIENMKGFMQEKPQNLVTK